MEGRHVAAEDWLEANRRQVALLTEEPYRPHLSDQEADESRAGTFPPGDHDMVVVDQMRR